MRSAHLLTLPILALLLVSTPVPATGEATSHVKHSEVRLAWGTKWVTTAYIAQASASGPTVMIVGGVHGTETGGWRAAEQIRHWPIVCGKLVIVPRANTLGIDASKRLVPDGKPYDLNRRFPSEKGGKITGPLARSIWRFTRRHDPDWLLDLHESVDYHSRSTKKRRTLGNSLSCCAGEETEAAAKLMVAAANEPISSKEEKWVILHEPIEGSLARAAGARLGVRAIIVETSRKDYLATRIRQHRLVVHRLLTSLDMLEEGFSPYTMFGETRRRGEVRVALYDGPGTGGSSAHAVERCLRTDQRFASHRVTASGIRTGVLAPFDVVVFPGGTGSGTAKSLQTSGRRMVRTFVEEGGGCLGICAGAYLVSRHYSWSLHILDSRVEDTKHWARGSATVTIGLTEAGRRLFGEKRRKVSVWYAQGPLLAPGNDPEIPDYELIADFRTEVTENGAPKGVMIGSAAIVRGVFGKGRVIAMSPHPEQTRSIHAFIPKAVLWLAGR